jgi:tRNA-modifying protein YgfZ
MYSSDGYRALRTASAVIRRGDRGVLVVRGDDRLAWLQGLVTNDVSKLQPGESRYAASLTPQGRMISDMRVAELADCTFLEVPAVLAEALRVRLDALIFAEDVQIADETGSIAVVDIHGPQAVMPPAITAIAAIKDDVFGGSAMTLFVARNDVDVVVAKLLSAGAVETTLETLDVVRVESGTPQFLVDMDEHTIPLEAGIEDRAISFTKGCYVGQEVIVRVTQRGHGRVAKKLIGFQFDKNASPKSGDSVRAGERDVGRITSAVWSPALERPIALGYVHRDFVAPGTAVEVKTAGGWAAATIAKLPFVAPASAP